MKPAMRIVVARGKLKRRFVVVAPPFPKIGDLCTLDKLDWEVVKTERTTALSVSFPKARVRQVFPDRTLQMRRQA